MLTGELSCERHILMSFESESLPREGELWVFRGESKELRWPSRPGFCAIVTLFGGDTLTVVSSSREINNGFDELRYVFLVRELHGWRLTGRVLWSTLFWNGMRRITP